MFQQVSADVYVMLMAMVLPPQECAQDLAPVLAGEADMVIGSRLHANSKSEFRPLTASATGSFLKNTQQQFQSQDHRSALRPIEPSVAGSFKSVPCSWRLRNRDRN